MQNDDTIAAISTPPGEGGIAIVRVSGTAARAMAARVFRAANSGNMKRFGGYTVHYGRFCDAAGEVFDDGLLTVFRAPHSYTGEDVCELSCHGGRVTASRLLQAALDAGARSAEPGEFTLRAFLNGRIDLAQAEAVADVIRARTDAALRQARRQLDGGLSQKIGAMRHEMVGIVAAIEVTIDFSDEAGELEYAPLQARIGAVIGAIETLLATAERGRLLREGLRVAIVGRPNVGKSSLLNALLRTERAIVTPIAGTTRDVVEEAANIGGMPVVLVDTAGLRETTDAVEQIGVERARREASSANVTLLVFEATAGVTEADGAIAAEVLAAENRVLIVWNKCDTPDAALDFRLPEMLTSLSAVRLSALTGIGLDALEAQISALLGADSGGEAADSVVVASARHRQALQSALESLREAERTAAGLLPGDFVAIDIRGALDALGQITGETVTDDVIHRIFHDFCVGK